MKLGKAALALSLISVVVALVALYGAGRSEASGGPPSVVIMRCLAFAEPSFTYQVVALSHTADLEIDVQASTFDGEGDDCAVAMAEILDATGLKEKDLRYDASDNALVVTLID